MKKSVVALAVLGAFTGLASAQSSVTLYGRIDQNLTNVDPGSKGKAGNSSNTNAGESVTKINDGGVNGLGASRFGMRGVEDLGDGLKAYFKLESGITVDNGVDGGATQTSSNSMFNREAYVGLGSTTWGDVRLGRLETLSREANRLVNDASGENQLNIAEVIDTARDQNPTPATTKYKQNRVYFNNFGTRVDNAISYRSPSFMGMAQMIATYGLSEGAAAPSGNAQAAFGGTNTIIKGNIASYTGVGFIVTAGPLSADLIYEQLNGGGQSGTFGKTGTIGANYDLGFAKIYAAYQDGSDVTQAFGQNAETVFTSGTGSNSKVSGVDLSASNYGVKVPFGKWTFVAQYTQSELSGNNLKNSVWATNSLKQSKYGMSAEYAFSKRTSVYGVVIGRSGDQDEYFNRKNEYALGLAHTF